MRIIIVVAAAALVAGCGGSPTKDAKAEGTAAKLAPGEYRLAWSDVSFAGSDKKDAAAAQAKAQAALPESACVAAGGALDPAAFAADDDKCHSVNSYVRNGILNVQFSCMRDDGAVSQMANGTFTAEAFDANFETQSNFAEGDNFTLKAKVTGTRTGQCAPATDEAKAS